MTETAHADLQDAIDQAKADEDAAYRAYVAASPDDGPARLIDYVRASTRRSTLNEAGLIITLGKGEPRDENTG